MNYLTRDTFGGLWRHSEFMKLWGGQTISQVGSQVTLLALPLTAVLVLHATPGQMGLLYAAETAPFLVVALAAGVWVDRLRRRPILIGGDLSRALLLAWLPIGALLGVLRIEQLYVVAVLVGLCTVFFDVAYQSFVPVLVGREHLVEGNSKLEVSRSAAQIVGPGLGGLLVQTITAPVAIIVDALSFLISGLVLILIKTPEPAPGISRRGVRAEIGEGLSIVLGNSLLRSIAGCTGTSNVFGSALQAVLVLYATRDLGLPPALLGVALGAGSLGALLAALLSSRIADRIGLGTSIVGGISLGGVASLLIALASGPPSVAAAVLGLAQALFGFGGVLYNINQVSLRQAITPDRLLGRMNATMRFIVWGTMPIGALLGGSLGEAIGLRGTLAVVAAGALVTPLWVLLSPVRKLREQPTPATT
ncbi:MAG: MFS transporter [Chloroflexi bacterium]|nr:MFS transporter [Chloroflexota bacterium]